MGKQGLLYRFDQRGIDKEMARRAVNFSVSDNHEKLLGIIDAKKQTGNFSDWICKTLIAKWEDEQRGNKITIYTGEQSKLPTLPPIYEPLKPEDLVGLTYDEKRTIYYALGQSLTVVEKDIRKAEAQR